VSSDKPLNLWYVDLDKKTPVRIDRNLYDSPGYVKTAAWSPDGRWIACSKQLHNHLHAVEVYSLPDAKSTQVTDGAAAHRLQNRGRTRCSGSSDLAIR
jgi:tricorn protease-like protein